MKELQERNEQSSTTFGFIIFCLSHLTIKRLIEETKHNSMK